MLANDFIGFHTKEYCDNYLEALQEWFPVEIRVKNHFYEIIYQGQVTTIGAFPIGLDVDRILSEVSEDKTLEHKVNGEELDPVCPVAFVDLPARWSAARSRLDTEAGPARGQARADPCAAD